ncbi:hypothetical protein T552_02879 [Pneumocystis carinii B80]|uniref:PCI domain-containing protein n=1 Tax=Pneumocystis carinii (strain B80) TaxID=1408658 RepID=A0A0W4ZDL2_PNEC8|nr:hypothetical protein T552_02879 [Pneumocystis carinii B80]KTW26398.1 hypothetical protein T552_02879 [Pneumocystis carinii B80]
MSLQEFFNRLSSVYEKSIGVDLLDIFIFDGTNENINQLKKELFQQETTDILKECEWRFGSWKIFSEFVMAYLEFVKNVVFSDIEIFYKLYYQVFLQFITTFSHSNATWLTPLVKYMSLILTKVSIQLDNLTQDPHQSATNETSRAIFRLFNIILSDRHPLPDSKKVCTLYIANLLLRLYFKLNQTRLCQTISSNITSSGIEFSLYPISERVGFSYYLGRYNLYQQQITRARGHLLFAFDNCLTENYKNKRLILIYLTTASIILGIFPSSELLIKFHLSQYFSPVISCLIKGDHRRFTDHINHDAIRSWLLKKQIFLTIRDHCEILLWRSLFRRSFLITRDPSQKPPRVKLEDLLIAAKWAKNDDTYDLLDVECICISLLDQNYLQAYILHASKLLVLKRDDTHGFQKISNVKALQAAHDDDVTFGW